MIKHKPILASSYRSPKQIQQGFSLLETLIAFAILVLVLAVTFKVYASGARSTRLANEYAQATIIAQSKLAEFKAGSLQLSGTEKERYKWQLQREEIHFNDIGSKINYQRSFITYELNVEVSWLSAGKQRNVSIDTVQLATK